MILREDELMVGHKRIMVKQIARERDSNRLPSMIPYKAITGPVVRALGLSIQPSL